MSKLIANQDDESTGILNSINLIKKRREENAIGDEYVVPFPPDETEKIKVDNVTKYNTYESFAAYKNKKMLTDLLLILLFILIIIYITRG